jgi:hypothetical protein
VDPYGSSRPGDAELVYQSNHQGLVFQEQLYNCKHTLEIGLPVVLTPLLAIGLASSPFRRTHFKLAESFSALRYLPCDIIFSILPVFGVPKTWRNITCTCSAFTFLSLDRAFTFLSTSSGVFQSPPISCSCSVSSSFFTSSRCSFAPFFSLLDTRSANGWKLLSQYTSASAL